MYAKFDRLTTKDWSLYRDGEYIGSQGSVREIGRWAGGSGAAAGT